MIISVGYTQAKVVGSPVELDWLYEVLSFDVPGAEHTKAAEKGWDGKVHLFRLGSSTMPAGLAPLARRWARQKGFTVDLIDQRKQPTKTKLIGDVAPWLRDYQVEAVEAALRRTRGILWGGTGIGKTQIAVALALVTQARTLFLCDQTDLMHQAAQRYEKYAGKQAGLIGEGQWTSRQFTVATIQTLYKVLSAPAVKELLNNVQLVVMDECHRAGAKTHRKVLMMVKKAYWRIGLSGTPLQRSDAGNLRVIAAIGPVIWKLRSGEAVKQGILSKPIARFVRYRPKNTRIINGSWHAVYQTGIVANTERNQLLTRVVNAAKKPCLVFVNEIRHGELLKTRIQSEEWRTEFVWASSGGAARLAAIQRLRKGVTEVCIASPVFTQGVDIPELRSVVIAAGGKSPIITLQRVGRGMRKTEGKDTFEIWDVKDEGTYYLQKHANARISTLVREGFQVVQVTEDSLIVKGK